SITSNIAEGFGRQTYKEKIQFYYIALGSLTELQNQLIVTKDTGRLGELNFKEIYDKSVEVHKIINGLIKKSKTYLNS
ncbi:four helix bundle protein, partial [Candidatus Saccharibacteria bacterium]|nr:four helix bundle protein [Candidatus Saccharibacteria bacterium]NIV03186.1 four helix bundle protein [Calditrichia bacterium]NIS37692.1 four helix bundle protein [Candidatus Saccharibacteria bacterium]NIV71298.1 four helix bundle protein [Calditrichia bacterium]NIV97786.1 four helix bundle protein [Candidatus Saccharibacteria bacterium]